jgi:hypothetical protein
MMVAVGPSFSFVVSRFRRRRRGCIKGEGRRLGASLVGVDSAVPLPSPPTDAMGESDSLRGRADLDLEASRLPRLGRLPPRRRRPQARLTSNLRLVWEEAVVAA